MNKVKLSILSATTLLVPIFAGAADGDLDGITNIAIGLETVVSTILPIAFALILVAFFWGLAKYVLSAGDEEKKSEGRNLMIYGVAALFIAASIWGIISFIGTNLGITDTAVLNPTAGVI